MKPTFLSGLFGGLNWLPTVFGLAFFVLGSLTFLRAADGATSREGGLFMAILGAAMLSILVYNAHRKSR